jgi:cholesterol transport system auxiliary component
MFSFLVAMLCLAAAGCVRGTRPAPDLTYLDISPGSAPVTNGSSQEVLLLRRLDVQSPFDDRRFHYRTGPGTYETDYYVRFVASPSDLLTDRLEEWLNESRIFHAVVESGSSAEYRYILEGEILELYGDYTKPQQAAAVIEADFVLVDDRVGAGRIVFEKQYRQTVPVVPSDARILAASWGEALRGVFLKLVEDLQGTLGKVDK